MGAIGGLVGLGGGASGTGFAGPGGAQLTAPTNAQQVQGAYDATQSSIAQQQSLLQALQAQNGIANQSAVYKQLQNVANGVGPNPAQAMLAQQTGTNVANQAALMAGQRGSGANAGLIARQAAQQGAATQQQAVGQGSTLQAQQSLGALGQMQGLANTQVGQQIGQTNTNTQAQLAEQGALLNALQGYNSANVQMQSNINQQNASLAGTSMQGQQNLIGGVTNGLGMAFLAGGGEVNSGSPSLGADTQLPTPTYTPFTPNNPQPTSTPMSGPKSSAGQYLSGKPQSNQPAMQQAGQTLGNVMGQGIKSIFGGSDDGSVNMAKGGRVSAMLSPDEIYLTPNKVKEVAKSPNKGEKALKEGERIKGKAKVPGDSLKNDTVPKTLEKGGIVVKRTAAQDPKRAEAFINSILNKKRLGSK